MFAPQAERSFGLPRFMSTRPSLARSVLAQSAVGIEHALPVTLYRLQRRGAGKEQRVALLGGPGQVICRGQHFSW
jgi:hypothetical protein